MGSHIPIRQLRRSSRRKIPVGQADPDHLFELQHEFHPPAGVDALDPFKDHLVVEARALEMLDPDHE